MAAVFVVLSAMWMVTDFFEKKRRYQRYLQLREQQMKDKVPVRPYRPADSNSDHSKIDDDSWFLSNKNKSDVQVDYL